MNEKEYYSIKEVSKLVGLTPQSIRRRLKDIIMVGKDLIIKRDGCYFIHELILYKFSRKRVSNEFAYSLDFPKEYTKKDIDSVLQYIVNDFGKDEITIEYTIEYKKKDQIPHIHAIISTSNRRLFEKKIYVLLGGNSYDIQAIYNKNKWLQYMTKDVATTTIITNKVR